MKICALAFILSSLCLASCSDSEEFQITKSDAESGRGSHNFDFVESFGASEGPFRSLGGPNGNYGAGITFRVTVNGKTIEKEYIPEDDSYTYAADYYLNENDDGFAVVHKLHKKE